MERIRTAVPALGTDDTYDTQGVLTERGNQLGEPDGTDSGTPDVRQRGTAVPDPVGPRSVSIAQADPAAHESSSPLYREERDRWLSECSCGWEHESATSLEARIAWENHKSTEVMPWETEDEDG